MAGLGRSLHQGNPIRKPRPFWLKVWVEGARIKIMDRNDQVTVGRQLQLQLQKVFLASSPPSSLDWAVEELGK